MIDDVFIPVALSIPKCGMIIVRVIRVTLGFGINYTPDDQS
jgi:hypothetical protein